jgi:hypothetical protein
VRGRSYCRSCAIPVPTEHLTEVARAAREAGLIVFFACRRVVLNASSELLRG